MADVIPPSRAGLRWRGLRRRSGRRQFLGFRAWLCVLALCGTGALPAPAADVVDPAMLAGLRDSVCFAESFEALRAGDTGTLTEGLVGKAYETAGNWTIDVAAVLPQGAGTIGWWARHDFDSTAGASLLSLDNGSSLYLNFYGTSSSDPRHREIGHLWSTLFGAQFARYPGTVKPQTWHHFALTWEGDEVTAYFDGGLCSRARGSGGATFSSLGVTTLTLGDPYADPAKEPGRRTRFDELRIYNRALTAAEVRAYVLAFKQGGRVQEMAAAVPATPAARDTLGLRAAYRLSDHTVQVYGDLAILAPQGSVEVCLHIAAAKGDAIIQKSYPGVDPKAPFHASLPVPPLADGVYSVVLDVDGKTVRTSFDRRREEWEDNRIGVPDKVIPPWTPLTVSRSWPFGAGRTAACWGREYTFGALGLPERIRSTQPEPTRGEASVDLLAEAVRLRIEGPAGPLEVSGKTPRLRQQSEASVTVAAEGRAGALRIRTTGILEFDGFYKFTVRIEPTRPTEVHSIRLEVALPDRLACLFNASGENMRGNKAFLDLEGMPDGPLWDSIESNVVNAGTEQKRVRVRRDGDIGNFYPHLWFGDDDRGIAFMGDSTRGWVLDERQPCQDLVRENGRTVLRLHLLNTAVVLTDPVEAVLSLQATPVRPRPPGGSWRKVEWYGWGHFDEAVLWSDCFAAYQDGKVPGTNGPWYRTPEAKEKNLWWRYFCFQTHRMSVEDPEYGDTIRRNADEWGAGLHVPSHRDFLLWAYRQWHDIASLDGIYYDNTYASPTTALGSGLAWRDAEGRTHGSFNTFGDREFMKRVRAYFLEQGPAPVLKVHITDAPLVGYLGFADFWLDGENGGYLTAAQEERAAREGDRVWDFVDRWYNKTGLTNLRITLGRQWGTIPAYLYAWGAEPTQAMLGMFDLDNGLWRMNGVADGFGLAEPDVEFIPYWAPHRPVTITAGGPDVFATVWRRPGRVRILLSNLAAEHRQMEAKLDLAQLSLPANAVAVDAQSHEPVAYDAQAGILRPVLVNAHGYRVILLAAPEALPATPAHLAKSMALPNRVAPLCDAFATLSPEWKLHAPPGAAGRVTHWAGTLRLAGAEGRVLARPFGLENGSVQVKIMTSGGFWDGGPSLVLYWNQDSYALITAGGMCPMPDGPNIQATAVAAGKTLGRCAGPPAGVASWVKIKLSPDTIEFSCSTDAKTWTRLNSVPRQGLEGAPRFLLLGTPMAGAEFGVGQGRGAGDVFFDDLEIGTELP